MNNVLVIARREIRERSFVFLTAIGVAILPYLIALLPGMQSVGRSEVIGAAGSMLAFAFALGLATVLGTSTVSRELVDGRLSFYFSRPLSAASIWFGKLTASLFAIVATFTVIAVPAYLSSGPQWRGFWSSRPALIGAGIIAISMLAFVVSHAVATMVRSRTPLVLLDFVLLSALVFAVWLLVRPLLTALAFGLSLRITIALVAAIALVLAIAPAWQLSRGRTDRRRNHFELSRIVWSSIAVLLLIASAYVGWVVSAKPTDLEGGISTLTAPAGPWFYVNGAAGGRFDYRPTFLVNAANGEHVRVPAYLFWDTAFTKDGRVAFWKRPVAVNNWRNFTAQLAYRRLDDPNAEMVTTSIAVGPNTEIAMSDDFARAAVIDNDTLTIHDFAHDRIVASAKIPKSSNYPWRSMYFLGDDVVRVIDRSRASSVRDEPVTIRIYEFDAKRRALTKTGEATFVTRQLTVIASADGSRLLVRMPPGKQSVLLDARTAATLLTIPNESLGGWPWILSDGSIAGFVRAADGRRFRVMNAAGAITTDMKVEGFQNAQMMREIAPGKVLAVLSKPGWKTVVIDTQRGAIVHSADALGVIADTIASSDPRMPGIDPSQPIIGMEATGSIVRWNPESGEKSVIVKRS